MPIMKTAHIYRKIYGFYQNLLCKYRTYSPLKTQRLMTSFQKKKERERPLSIKHLSLFLQQIALFA